MLRAPSESSSRASTGVTRVRPRGAWEPMARRLRDPCMPRRLAPLLSLVVGCARGAETSVATSAAAPIAAPPAATVQQPAHKPNIVLIVIDTARADHFSCYGYGQH